MIKQNRPYRPKYREDIWVLLDNEYVLGKFVGYDHVTHETIIQVDKRVIKLQPQILPYK
jgi:hypothetical protein